MIAVSALLFGSSALVGIGFSGATWTHTTESPVTVTASPDWTPPSVSVATLPAGIFGTTTVTATAVDARSGIGSVTLEYAPTGGATWTAITTGCTASSGASPLVYSCQWNTASGVPDGDYEVRARTADTASPTPYSATSATVPTQVANSTSVVLTTIPDHVRGTVSLTAGFLQPVPGNTRLHIEHLVGATWTQVGNCTLANQQTMTCSWDTTTFTNGTHDLRARAENGNLTWTDEQSGVVVDNQAPTVTSLTVPAGVLSGSVLLAATASDAVTSVAAVHFDYQLGPGSWQECGIDSSFPYSCILDTTSLPAGSYTIRATATDAVGNISAPATQTRTVSNAAASVSIASPIANAVVSGASFPVTAVASSDRGVAQVRIDFRAANGTFTELCTAQTAPYSCNWNASSLGNGSYELRAVMTETSGGATLTSSSVAVTVNNSVGSVAVTSPVAGSTVSGTTSVSATATPANGTTVTSVRYEAGPVGGPYVAACGPVILAPYTCAWNTSAIAYAASYELRAIMLQGNLSTVTSSVSVKVDNVTGSVALTSPLANARLHGVVSGAVSVTSNAAATSVRIIATPTRPAGSAVSIPCLAGAGTPPAAVAYSCSWDTSAIVNVDYTLQAEATLANGTVVTSASKSVLVRNLHGQDVQMNAGATANSTGTITNKDSLTLTFTDQVLLSSIKSGFAGSPKQTFNVTIKDEAGGDRLVFPAGVNLGSVKFTQNYVTADATISVDMTATTAAGAPTVVTIAFGNPPGNAPVVTDATSGAMTWTPSALVTDTDSPAVACSIATTTESGTSDADF